MYYRMIDMHVERRMISNDGTELTKESNAFHFSDSTSPVPETSWSKVSIRFLIFYTLFITVFIQR